MVNVLDQEDIHDRYHNIPTALIQNTSINCISTELFILDGIGDYSRMVLVPHNSAFRTNPDFLDYRRVVLVRMMG
jgi:hypothetical protein